MAFDDYELKFKDALLATQSQKQSQSLINARANITNLGAMYSSTSVSMANSNIVSGNYIDPSVMGNFNDFYANQPAVQWLPYTGDVITVTPNRSIDFDALISKMQGLLFKIAEVRQV